MKNFPWNEIFQAKRMTDYFKTYKLFMFKVIYDILTQKINYSVIIASEQSNKISKKEHKGSVDDAIV